MKLIKNLLFVTLFFMAATVMGQTKVTGTVVDENNQPLPGSSVLEKGTTNGTESDFDGQFTLNAQSNSGILVISYIGYKSIEISFSAAAANVGTLQLVEDADALDEVVIIGKGVIDLAGGRKTPVAVSTIKAAEIQRKIGTQDVTMTLVNTPSVYVAGQGGGFGDTRISVRGFDQTNTSYLLNGQPINGMEDGKMYWSNWSGISDIASAVQIQRGLGASKLAISSVGGTTNFVTKTTDKKPGGYFSTALANDAYFKSTMFYNTGQNESGFATSVMFTHWQGDGYNEGNKGQGQTYFVSFGYNPNEKHNFNFLITGAPQWHDQNYSKSISSYLEYGRRYNNNWGTYQGAYLTERRNFYHKPVMNINWDYTISDDSNLSSVLYASWGRGGGTGNRGNRERTNTGYVDYDAIYANNAAAVNGNFGNGAYITRSSMNNHSWYGMVSNYEKQFNDNLVWNVGADLRTYYGTHFRQVKDLHGLSSWTEDRRLKDGTHNRVGDVVSVTANTAFSANPWATFFNFASENERIDYDSSERISYAGVFTQLEYATDKLSAFVQGSLSQQNHQRFDRYDYDANSQDSEKVSNVGYNVKAGGSIIVDESNKVYVNPFTQNEDILGLELGYSYAKNNFSANVNLYRTSWKNRVVSSSRVVDGLIENTLNFGAEQLHQGIEIDFRTRLLNDKLTFKGFTSIGDWEYVGSTIRRVVDEDQVVLSESNNDVDGGKVGDAAQFTLGFGLDYAITDNFSVDFDWRLYDGLYANVGAVKENLELPTYDIADLGISYRLFIGENKDKNLDFRLNVNNLFYEVYLTDLRDNDEASPIASENWKGINKSNRGMFGWGRTWNASVKYSF